MNLTFSFCLNDTCDSEESFSVPVLENVKLPKQKCQWRESYRVKGEVEFANDHIHERNGSFLFPGFKNKLPCNRNCLGIRVSPNYNV